MKKRDKVASLLAHIVFSKPKGKSDSKDVFAAHFYASKRK